MTRLEVLHINILTPQDLAELKSLRDILFLFKQPDEEPGFLDEDTFLMSMETFFSGELSPGEKVLWQLNLQRLCMLLGKETCVWMLRWTHADCPVILCLP